MTVMGRRVMTRRAAKRDEDDLEEMVAGIVAEVLPQLIVDCLSDPTVIRALRTTVGGSRTSPVPPPLRPAQVKAARRRQL